LRALRVFGPAPYAWLFRLIKRQVRNWELPLTQFRAELGLPPLSGPAIFEGQFSPRLNLALFDPVLAQPQPDWPANTLVSGSPMFDGAAPDAAVAAELERFLDAGEPPIVFALGSSAVWVAGDFWKHAVAAAQALGRRAVLVTGPVIPHALPDGMRAFAYLPYSRVFPRAAAVVHQAGIGTLSQALRSGRPQLLVPVAFDQPDNAQRAVQLGVGRAVPFARTSARRLTAALEQLLVQPAHAAAAGAVAARLSAVDGAACAADALIADARR
jgi:UDP:flavonoid glycosyltransferase YjiC (YdhE family)